MTDVFHVLKDDHERVEAIFRRLESGMWSAGDGTDRQSARKKSVERLIIEESKHEAVEEEYFWPVVRELVTDGDLLADEAVEQEQKAKAILGELDGMPVGDDRFEELLTSFVDEARAHMRFEETRVWPLLRARLSELEAARLGSKLLRGKAIAPTHPHPGYAPEPGILKESGTLTAAADRLKDAATGRGKD